VRKSGWLVVLYQLVVVYVMLNLFVCFVED